MVDEEIYGELMRGGLYRELYVMRFRDEEASEQTKSIGQG